MHDFVIFVPFLPGIVNSKVRGKINRLPCVVRQKEKEKEGEGAVYVFVRALSYSAISRNQADGFVGIVFKKLLVHHLVGGN